MSKDTIFINRRNGSRRTEPDPCEEIEMDLYHRKRRKSSERRDTSRSLTEDYYAYTQTEEHGESEQSEA